MSKKLSGSHKAFLIQRFASFDDSATRLAVELQDGVIAEEFGFKAIEVTEACVRKFFQRDDKQTEMTAARESYLTDLQAIPIFNSAYRMRQLQKEYDALKDGVGVPRNMKGYMTGGEIRALRVKILAEAHKQSGEDVDKMAKALAASGGSSATLYVDLGSMSDDDKRLIRGNVAASYANNN